MMIMPRVSELPHDLATLPVEELRAALARQRAVNTRLRAVVDTQAATHETEVAARDALLAQLRSLLAELGSQVTAADALVAELRAQVVVLADRVVQLERRVGRDSSNSSRPPSSDSPYTKQPPALRGRSDRKRGKQPGEPGVSLSQVADPDEIVVCAPDRCAKCGCDLGDAPVAGMHKRQVFEPLPVPPR